MVLPAWQMKGACRAPEKGIAERAEHAETSIHEKCISSSGHIDLRAFVHSSPVVRAMSPGVLPDCQCNRCRY